MDSLGKSMSAAASGMSTQSFRMRIVTENLSNADTNDYQRKLVSFATVYDNETGEGTLTVGPVRTDKTPGDKVYEPFHPLADQDGYVTKSNVDMMIEMADAKEAGRSYEANLTAFQQAREMYSSLIALLRR
ncbi:flagellar basal body rod protein FlgC [Aquisalinus flavus]|uniref:Flagellar basal-body rod protein FlgC n=2 Tax=Aquisalinus flavus TaxID=1526572 RepID=A0A8J2V702_9PROT|nr:flagellar basal body rod protein FlgC [Aquisalinus flavus]MBD0425921.1 flagellar basal body rod protein FlgC [Aquisalinus flavus]UNE48485.1 flagellar basal body rod protein FlgC [Aquisalinus flavus]GGD12205.1 flagellar basal body rod protein FlgC [Aquisalinus flavus]